MTQTICCELCKSQWTRLTGGSEFERQAVESQPCPRCESYTLSVVPPPETKSRRLHRTSPEYRLATA